MDLSPEILYLPTNTHGCFSSPYSLAKRLISSLSFTCESPRIGEPGRPFAFRVGL